MNPVAFSPAQLAAIEAAEVERWIDHLTRAAGQRCPGGTVAGRSLDELVPAAVADGLDLGFMPLPALEWFVRATLHLADRPGIDAGVRQRWSDLVHHRAWPAARRIAYADRVLAGS